MSEWPFIVAAYAAAWLVLAGYGFYLSGRARRSAIEASAAEAEGSGKREAGSAI